MSDQRATFQLRQAIEAGDANSAARAIAEGADVNAKAGIWPFPSFLHLAAARGAMPIIKSLVDRGAKNNALTDAGETPLHWAVQGMRRPYCVIRDKLSLCN